jgi:small conductance mechanosensitive channel
MGYITALILLLLTAIALYAMTPKIVTWLVTHMFLTPYQRTLHRKDLEKRQKTVADLLVNLIRIMIVFITLYFLLIQVIPVETLTPLFASAGIFGVALAFGAQSLIKDFLSGVFIISENQYRVGDVIEIEGFGGVVEKIGVRSTVIRDVDGNVHYFPNGMVQHVINKTLGYSMARFTVAVAPDTDIDDVAKIINEEGLALAKLEKWQNKILEAPQYVMMGDFTSNAVNLIVSGKTQPSDQWAVTAEMRQRLLERFEKDGIVLGTVPFSQAPKTSQKKK